MSTGGPPIVQLALILQSAQFAIDQGRGNMAMPEPLPVLNNYEETRSRQKALDKNQKSRPSQKPQHFAKSDRPAHSRSGSRK